MCEVFKCKIRRFILTPYFTKCEWKLTRMSITTSSITTLPTVINILTIITIITMIVHYDHLLWASWSWSTPSERILRSAFCQPRSIDLSQPKSSHTLAAVEIILIIHDALTLKNKKYRCWIESMFGWDISGIWQIWSRFWYETHCQRVEADLGWNMLNKWKRFLSSNICICSCIFMSAGSSPNHFLSLWRRCFSFWSDSCSKSCDLLRTKNNPATCLLVRPTCTE